MVDTKPQHQYEIGQCLNNLNGIKPEVVSADTIYRTIINATYLNKNSIGFLTPTRKQGKESINHLNNNPFSIDYFEYDPY